MENSSDLLFRALRSLSNWESHDSLLIRIEKEISNAGPATQFKNLAFLERYIRGHVRNLDPDYEDGFCINEDLFPQEIALIHAILDRLALPDSYIEERNRSLEKVKQAFDNDRDLQYARHQWPGMDQGARQWILQKAAALQARHQVIGGIRAPQDIRFSFSAVAKKRHPGTGSELIPLASMGNNPLDAGLRIKFNKPFFDYTPFYSKHWQNTHRDAGFARRDFSLAIALSVHEQQHAMQAALIRAYKDSKLAPDNPAYEAARLFYYSKKYHAYIPSGIYSAYRQQFIEKDTFTVQDMIEDHLSKDNPKAAWAEDQTKARRYVRNNAAIIALNILTTALPLPR